MSEGGGGSNFDFGLIWEHVQVRALHRHPIFWYCCLPASKGNMHANELEGFVSSTCQLKRENTLKTNASRLEYFGKQFLND